MAFHYGAQALRIFAEVLAAASGNRVDVLVQGQQACTDGQRVYLPDHGIWDEDSFRAVCGIAVHEVSHIAFRSNATQKDFLSQFDQRDQPLAQACFNAVIDVADETRMLKALPRAKGLLAASSSSSLASAVDAGAIPPKPPLQPSTWQLLAAGIWLVRSEPGSSVRSTFRGWRTRVPALDDVIRILRRARDRSRSSGTAVPRTPAQWRRLKGLVRELIDLLRRSGLDEMPSDGTTDSPPGAEAVNDPHGSWRVRARGTLVQNAGHHAAAGALADCEDWTEAVLGDGDESELDDLDDPSFTGGFLLPGLFESETPIDYDHALYQQVFPAFRMTARSFPVSQTMEYEDGHRSGGAFCRPHRAWTDGKCFRRACVEEETSGAVAFLFDHSDSMADTLGMFLPVGVALADAVELAGFEVAAWRYGTTVERMARLHDLEQPGLIGSTRTDLALGAARLWLKSRPVSYRLVVLFTDGEPDDRNAMGAEISQLRRLGAELLFGSLGMGYAQCEALAAAVAPWASVFNVEPSHAASSLQVALRRIARRGRG